MFGRFKVFVQFVVNVKIILLVFQKIKYHFPCRAVCIAVHNAKKLFLAKE